MVDRDLIRQLLKGIGVGPADPQAKRLLAELMESGLFDAGPHALFRGARMVGAASDQSGRAFAAGS